MQSIFEIAKYFLSKNSMSNKKLQKLCYYAEAWYYVITKKHLTDTYFEAWDHGPVSPELYKHYQEWGWLDISCDCKDVSFITDEAMRTFLNKIYDVYGKYSANQLEEIACNEQPWKNARQSHKMHQHTKNRISYSDILAFYDTIHHVT